MIARVLIAALLGVAFAGAVRAQVGAAPDSAIVVEGRRQAYHEDRDAIRAVAIRHDDQIARFEAKVCPLVIGLSRDLAAGIETRIGTVATQAGIGADRPGCSPNIVVIVASHGAETVATLRKQRADFFTSLTNAERDRLDRDAGPAWNWSLTEPKRRDGAAVEHVSMIAMCMMCPPEPVAKHAYILSNGEKSLIATPVRLDTSLAFVVIEAKAIEGLTLTQIGDFAAMLGLGSVNYDRAATLHQRSILSVLDGPDPRPEGTTPFDIAYLRGLYAGDPSQSFDHRSNQIAEHMRHETALRVAR